MTFNNWMMGTYSTKILEVQLYVSNNTVVKYVSIFRITPMKNKDVWSKR